MREIKFKAWDTENRCFQEIDNIVIARNEMPTSINSGKYQIQSNGQIVLLQYTGLKDKNGVEIYEGDIVKYKTFYYGKEKERIVEVKWEKEATDLFGEPDFIGFLARWEGGEVIGNIYENPELLNKK